MNPTHERMDEVFDALRSPAEAVLARHGITLNKPGNKGWRNMSRCPWCGHDNNFQCGIAEKQANNGWTHSVNCMHMHDSPTGEANPHYADFLAALGEISDEEAHWVKNHKRTATSPAAGYKPRSIQTISTVSTVNTIPTRRIVPEPERPLGFMNEDNNLRARKRLRDNADAMNYLLTVRGFTLKTIERFKLGLSESYVKDDLEVHASALAAPLIGFDGRFYKKYVNYVIPGVTVDNRQKPQRAWSPGNARAYYNGRTQGKPWLFICDGLKDVWALSQFLEGSDLDASLVVASSTNGGQGVPEDWRTPEFWEQWENVFFGHDNDAPHKLTGRRAGDEHALALAKIADREVLRVTPPVVKDWNDWTLVGHRIEEFKALLEAAELIQTVEPIQDDDGQSQGRFSANPIAIVGAFNEGYLYEAVRTLVRTLDEDTGEMVERYDTVVVRSDRTTHRVKAMPAPKGTAEHNIVRRLSPDGTMIAGALEPNPNLTWRWDSIQSWLNGKDRTPPLSRLVQRIEDHLRGSVWLPHTDDYAILACAAVASFVQQVFDAVPLILVTGAAGTGKSELGMAMKSMGANSKNVLGVISAATMARFIDATRGLVVIDDLEEISGVKDQTFGDLIQTLKLSYKKATAQKMVTEMKNGKAIQRNFNFFGIKIISNTQGADSILGTRMLTIQTRHMPKGVIIQKELLMSPEALDDLRDQLHCWAFSSVSAVYEAYQAIFPNKTGRQEEISAPLRVIAALSGSEAISQSLERALERQIKVKKNPDSPEDLLKESLTFILRRSIERDGVIPTWVTITQVMMEMRTLVDDNYGKEFTTSLASIEKPEWVGRHLRQVYAEDANALQARTNMYGKGLRAYQLSSEFISSVMEQITQESPDVAAQTLSTSKDFKSFCSGCSGCPYRNRCDMQAEREKSEDRKST